MRDVSILLDNGVELEESLKLLGDLEFYEETMEGFMVEQESRVPNLKKYLDELDMENYSILVHAMKSDCKYLGFKKLADLSYEHELNSKSNNIDAVKSKFDELMKEVEVVNDIVRKYLGE